MCLLRKTILNKSSDTTIVQATENTIHELCMVRDNQLLLDLEGGDVSDVIEYLCADWFYDVIVRFCALCSFVPFTCK